jgi:hypothetical protein
MLTYDELKHKPRELLAATGLKQDEFEALLVEFGKAYDEAQPKDQTHGGQTRQRRIGGGNKSKLGSVADKLLFILVYHKTYPFYVNMQASLKDGQSGSNLGKLCSTVNRAECSGCGAKRIVFRLRGSVGNLVKG